MRNAALFLLILPALGAYRPETEDVLWTGTHTWASSATFQAGDFSIAGSTFVVTGGQVGIGTPSPIQLLHLRKDQDADTTLRVANFNVSSNAGSLVSVNAEAGGYDPRIAFTLGGGGFDWRIGVDNDAADQLKIAGGNDNSTDVGTNTHVTISTSGRVGIGTVTMNSKLVVAGGLAFDNDVDNSGARSGSLQGWTTSGVTTTATEIADMNYIGNGGLAVVVGTDGSGNNFSDLVWLVYTQSPVVIQSGTSGGGPAARTYSLSGVSVRLQMGSGTYTVRLAALGI